MGNHTSLLDMCYLDVCSLLYHINFIINTILWIIGIEVVRSGMVEIYGELVWLNIIVGYCYVK